MIQVAIFQDGGRLKIAMLLIRLKMFPPFRFSISFTVAWLNFNRGGTFRRGISMFPSLPEVFSLFLFFIIFFYSNFARVLHKNIKFIIYENHYSTACNKDSSTLTGKKKRKNKKGKKEKLLLKLTITH